MKIAFFKMEDWQKEMVRNHPALASRRDDLVFIDEGLDKDHIPEGADDIEAICVFISSRVPREVIDAMPNLKLIATRSTGFDHIDLDAARERGIAVSNVPRYGENTVAEFTFALILSLSRKVHIAYDQVREEGSFSLDGLRGMDITGKTLGVIGTGNIGANVIKIGNGFNMRVLAYDAAPKEALSHGLSFEYRSFEDVLRESDIVTLHVPYNEHTHHLLNDEKIGMMKQGAYLINTSRGGVVDTDALVRALLEKRLSGAALDVLEEEGIIRDELAFLAEGHPEEHNLKTVLQNHALIDLPNVIVTPHNAFNTVDALRRILQTTVENIAAYLEGAPTNNVAE